MVCRSVSPADSLLRKQPADHPPIRWFSFICSHRISRRSDRSSLCLRRCRNSRGFGICLRGSSYRKCHDQHKAGHGWKQRGKGRRERPCRGRYDFSRSQRYHWDSDWGQWGPCGFIRYRRISVSAFYARVYAPDGYLRNRLCIDGGRFTLAAISLFQKTAHLSSGRA